MESNKQQTENGNASDIQKSTNTQSQPIKSITRNTRTTVTQTRLTQENCQTSACSVADSLVRLFPLLDSEKDSESLVVRSSLKSLGLQEIKDHATYSWKMLRDCYQQTMDGASQKSSVAWMNWGMMSNGRCLTASTSESPRIVKESSLSAVLEDNVDKKYFLSEKAMEFLRRRTEENAKMNRGFAAQDSRYGALRNAGECYLAYSTNDSKKEIKQEYGVYDSDGVISPLQGTYRKLVGVTPVLTPDRPNKRQHGRRFKEDGEEMFTLTGQDVHGVMLDEAKIRRLTPTECERLQGFPDGWTIGSDTQRYKQLGNAVTVNVIREITKELMKNE